MAPTHCLAPSRLRTPVDAPVSATSYGRLFPDLPLFSADDAFLYALGRSGGLCDCGDGHDEPSSLGSEAAGWPFFGQFVAHDITADRSSIRHHVDPGELRNARSPQLNLECLYGDGPIGHPYLFRRDDPAKLLLGRDGADVLRNVEGTAIIGDPRNDSHVFMSQMHLAFATAHNEFVDRTRAAGVGDGQVFEHAARELRWHYQNVILREFLPRLVGGELTKLIASGDRRFYRPERDAFIPLEFADGAYRYGHSQIRHEYRLNGESPAMPIFPDLMGFCPVRPEHRVDWTRLFDLNGSATAQRAKKLDGRLVRALIALPAALTGETSVEELRSLATRDLERGEAVGLPSGEAVAKLLGETPLSADEVGAKSAGWPGETPLWYYVLREADVRAGGNRLGPVGGRIVGEVLIGLLDLDRTSVRHAPATWKPSHSLIELLMTDAARPARHGRD
jgi:Animal haem peroxidase